MAEERRQLLQPCHWVGEEGQDCPILSALPAKWRARFKQTEKGIWQIRFCLRRQMSLPSSFLYLAPGQVGSKVSTRKQILARAGAGRRWAGQCGVGHPPPQPLTLTQPLAAAKTSK